MNNTDLFIIIFAIASLMLFVTSPLTILYAQNPATSDLPMTTINETNSTVDVLNKTLPAENATDVVPVIPM